MRSVPGVHTHCSQTLRNLQVAPYFKDKHSQRHRSRMVNTLGKIVPADVALSFPLA